MKFAVNLAYFKRFYSSPANVHNEELQPFLSVQHYSPLILNFFEKNCTAGLDISHELNSGHLPRSMVIIILLKNATTTVGCNCMFLFLLLLVVYSFVPQNFAFSRMFGNFNPNN